MPGPLDKEGCLARGPYDGNTGERELAVSPFEALPVFLRGGNTHYMETILGHIIVKETPGYLRYFVEFLMLIIMEFFIFQPSPVELGLVIPSIVSD